MRSQQVFLLSQLRTWHTRRQEHSPQIYYNNTIVLYKSDANLPLALARRGVRAPLAREWLDFVARHPANRAGDPQTALRAYEVYRGYLAACRERDLGQQPE